MARIPQRTLVAPRDSGAQMPQGAYNSTIRATVGLIESVGGVADAIVEQGVKAQELKNETDVRNERRNMRELQAQFDLEKVGTDPTTWGDKWKQKLSAYESSVKSKGYAPVVNRTVEAGFKEFAVGSSIQVTGDVLKYNRREATSSIMQDVQDDADLGNYDTAMEGLDRLEELGLRSPSEVREMRTTLNKTKKNNTFAEAETNDPLQFQKDVQSGKVGEYKLSPAEQRIQQAKADRAVAVQQNKEITLIKNRVKAGLITDEKDLQKDLDESPTISDLHKKMITKNFADTKPLSYEERSGLLKQINNDFRAYQKEEIDLEEYSKRHANTGSLMDAFGNRPGGGGMASRWHIVNPDAFDPDKTRNPEEMLKRAKENKDVTSDMNLLIRQRMGIDVAFKTARHRPSEERVENEWLAKNPEWAAKNLDDGIDEDVLKAEYIAYEGKQKTMGFHVERSMMAQAEKHIAEMSPEDLAKFDSTKQQEYLDGIQAKTTVDVMAALSNPDGGTVITDDTRSDREKMRDNRFYVPKTSRAIRAEVESLQSRDAKFDEILDENAPVGGLSPTTTTSVPSNLTSFVKGLSNTKRGTGGVHISTYGQANDKTPDSNTIARRGFKNNLLREGSVALSPQIYNKHKPPIGSAVYINGQHVGYYEDRAPSGYKGQSYGQTVDVYDPKNKLGTLLKNAGNAKITFGPPRKQVSNS